uniref:Uncharacterized protein n=1 Tax=Ciona savignyi TaxID=51511 RepID=H2YSH4_CIOSA
SSVETPNRLSADEDFSRECSTIVDLGSHADKKPHLIGSDTTSSGYGESLASSPTSYAAISHTSKKKNAVSFTSPSHHQSPRATHTNSPINLKNTLDRRKEFEQEILDMI